MRLQNPNRVCSHHGRRPFTAPFCTRPLRTIHHANNSTMTTVVCLAVLEPTTSLHEATHEEAQERKRGPSIDQFDVKQLLENVAAAGTNGNKHMLRGADGRLSLKNFTRKQLEQWCMSFGEAPKRAMQIWRWMYADDNWVHALSDTLGKQNGLSARFIEAFDSAASCDGGLALQDVVRSKDGTRKLVFKLTGGEAAGGTVETVLIPVVRGASQRARITLCVSTQVGCAMNCQFCYTGRMGLLGNLTTAQIVEQVVEARRFMAAEGDTSTLTNLVFMGMGEPLHNPEAVADAIEIMCCPLGLHMSHNKVTVSTVGLIPEIQRFAPRTSAQLAVSLHATTDEVRDWIVPINRRYPLADLMAALRQLYPQQPRPQPPEQQLNAGTSVDEHSAGAGQVDEGSQASKYLTTSASARRSRQQGRAKAAQVKEQEAPEQGDQTTAHAQHSSLLIAYTMLKGINDTAEDAHRLLQLLDGIAAKVNLIVFNPHEGTHFFPSEDEQVVAFRSILVKGGLVCTVRYSRGDDEMAACGQLGDPGLSWKPAPLIEPPARFKALLEQQQAEFNERRAQQQQQEQAACV